MSEILTYDNLFAGHEMPAVTDTAVVPLGAGSLARGTVLGRVTASGKCVPVDSSKSDGSQEPYAVLAADAHAAEADAVVPVYLTGIFNASALTFGGTDAADAHRTACRRLGMFLRDNVKA
ncbi:head decoration protein [Aminithiophilus ramosus]|uniref:Head decoration protein n=1 Tax=Aminithiophilus ramosus TaxID=3029084 RepID=A0A9Q7ASM8_9BACT|nr:head decoration protein [Aminithiophilus ramosus]QTX33216.1 head decoration protein [Aminithiophilus ramosus]